MATAKENGDFREALGVKPPSEAVQFLNLLVYGDPGAGKTWLAGSAQDGKLTAPILYLDVEGGVTTLRHKADIDVVQVRSIDDIVKLHKKFVEQNNGYYKTVVLDSLTELRNVDMREIMHEVVNRRPDRDPDIPSLQEYGKSGERMRRIVRAFRDLECHTIMTCLAAYEKDDNNVITYSPALPGKLRSEVPGFFDIVGYLYNHVQNDESTRILQVQGTRRVVAKDRTSSLGSSLENTTVPQMWELIHAN